MQQVISPRGVITWSVLHRECNNVCHIISGRVIWIFQNGDHKIEYLVFHKYFVFLEKKKIPSEIHVFRSDQIFVINILLFTSVVCYCQNGKCSLCNKWWHSFMNQRLNHLVLLYKKCNCIRTMSLIHIIYIHIIKR